MRESVNFDIYAAVEALSQGEDVCLPCDTAWAMQARQCLVSRGRDGPEIDSIHCPLSHDSRAVLANSTSGSSGTFDIHKRSPPLIRKVALIFRRDKIIPLSSTGIVYGYNEAQ